MENAFTKIQLEQYKAKKAISERADIVSVFKNEIDKERINTKYKPVNARRLAIMLSVLKTNQELYEFLSICKDYKTRNGSFSKRFFGGFKKQERTQDFM